MNTIARPTAVVQETSEPMVVEEEVGRSMSECIKAPVDYQSSMRDLLRESIGYYIITEHLVGTSNLVPREGVLVRVESNAYVLQEKKDNTFLVCDYYSLKFFRRLPLNATPESIASAQQSSSGGSTSSAARYAPQRGNNRK